MTPRRAVLFDAGGTLVEPRPEEPGDRLARALGDPAYAPTIQDLVLRNVFASPADLASRLRAALDLAHDPQALVTEAWNDAHAPWVVSPGAVTCVAAVHAAGAQVAIVSNMWTPGLAALRRDGAEIAAHVDGWFVSSEEGAVKPSAALFQRALAALDVRPRDALMIGNDHAADVVPAIALGMSAVWLRRDEPRGGVVTVDPHAAPFPVPADVVPEGAVVARSLSDVRRIALTWLWAARADRSALTAPVRV